MIRSHFIRTLALLSCIVLFGEASQAVDAQQIQQAVIKGANFLKKAHGREPYNPGNHGLGSAALTGIAMLEGGIPPSDPVIVATAKYIRDGALAETKTYNIALAILFLDLLDEPTDVPLVQLLGVRLYGGMTASGAWTYDCGYGISGGEATRVKAILRADLPAPSTTELSTSPRPAQPKFDKNGFPVPTAPTPASRPEQAVGRLHPEVSRYFQYVRQQSLRNRQAVDGDNSNTQFGLIGLWVASRHGLPVNDAFSAIETRFLATQNKSDAGWSYTSEGSSTAAMTCAGLLGLAVGIGRSTTPAVLTSSEDPKKTNDPFYNPPPPKEAATPIKGSPRKQVATAAALQALGMVVRGAAQTGNAQGMDMGAGNQFYMLWSMERVAVAYNLKTIGNVDWHAWGANILLAPGMQKDDGSWEVGGYGPSINTSFAILFLVRANFTKDLTRQLTGKHADPGVSELRASGTIPLFSSAKGTSTNHDSTASRVRPKGIAGATDPPPVVPSGDTVADGIVKGLLGATDDFEVKLHEARDRKGGEYTTALVQSIPLLTGDKHALARDALAMRLTRMTAVTLRRMMTDTDAELRRGATLAAAMKDDKAHVPDLIERMSDPAEAVVRAARAGLQSLTGQKFDTSDQWKNWYESQPR